MRPKGIPLLLAVLLLVAGCGYSAEIHVRESPGALWPSPDEARYGSVQVVWIREYRKPAGLLAFPDGGKSRDLALYGIVYQYPAGAKSDEIDAEQRREIARIELEPVRRWDYGNLYGGSYEWAAPDRFRYRVKYGYAGDEKEAEGQIAVPPLA